MGEQTFSQIQKERRTIILLLFDSIAFHVQTYSMKTIFITALLLFSSFSFGQETTVAIENMEANVLFRGYANKIMINSHPEKGSSYQLTGSNVSITRKGNHFIVKPSQGKMAYLTVTERKEDGSTTVIGKKEFRVKNLPNPTLYWGWTSSGKAVHNQKPVLTCDYVDYFQMDVDFTILSWEAEYDGKTYTGEGTDISSLNELTQTFTELTEFTIVANIEGPDGISRKLAGSWFVRPTE